MCLWEFTDNVPIKKLRYNKEKGREDKVTIFLFFLYLEWVTTGCEAIMKISSIAPKALLENLTTDEIR